MSWFNHRTEFGSGTPLRRDSVAPAPLRVDSQLTDAGEGGQVPEAHAVQLQFCVRYALPEYISFMWQHGRYLIRRRRIGRLASGWMLVKSTSLAACHFVLLGRARHVYEFTIDQHGIIRASGTGVTLMPWADVGAIRRYSRGYLLVLKRGTLPIPFRCLDRLQTSAMEAFAATHKAAARR
jgi:hypothetical protein